MQGMLDYLRAQFVLCLLCGLLCPGLPISGGQVTAAVRGDVAPYGMPDGKLNGADLGVVRQFIAGSRIPGNSELQSCDVAPHGAPDGTLDVADYLLLERAALGLVVLDPLVEMAAPLLWGVEGRVTRNPHFLSGLAQPNALVRVYRDAVVAGDVMADGNGLFSTSLQLLAGVPHSIHVTQVQGGMESPPSSSLLVELLEPGFIDRVLVNVEYDDNAYKQPKNADDPLPDNIFLTGVAGSTSPGAAITIRLTDGSVWTAQAAADGSFAIALAVYREEDGKMVRNADVASISVGEARIQYFATGMLAARFEVTLAGAASYSIPLALPPGTAGMAPDLSLDFDSHGGNGQLGRGWSMGGLSAITRCPKSLAQDGEPGRINLDADDRFCLDGQRLVAVSGSYGGDLAEYRTEVESFSQVFSYGGTGSSPDYFVVRTRAGRVMRYGYNPDSGLDPGGGGKMLWALDRAADRQGNYFTVSYQEDAVSGEHYPLRVDYTGNDGAGLATYNSVRFVYESRPDISDGYIGGRQVAGTRRLAHIHSYEGAEVVRDYRLTYYAGSATDTSLLNSITECATDATDAVCLPPTRFDWSINLPGFAAGITSGTTNGGYENARVMDVNGDGRQDLIVPHDDAWWINYGDDSGLLAQVHSGISTAGAFPEYALVIDYDSDGLTDLLVPGNDGYWDLLHAEAGGLAQVANLLPNAGYDQFPRVVDINGDGREDLATLQDTGAGRHWHIRLNTQSGLGAPLDTGFYRYGTRARAIDYDNDGRTDLLTAFYRGFVNGEPVCEWWLLGFDGQDFGHSLVSGATRDQYGINAGCMSSTGTGYSFLGDLNGDGLQDLSFYKAGAAWQFVHHTAAGFNGPLLDTGLVDDNQWYAQPLDYNSDGRMDFLVPSSADGRWHVYQATPGAMLDINTGPAHSGYKDTRVMDVNGDGLPDIVSPYAGSWYVHFRNAPQPYQLVAITGGPGHTTRIVYSALTDDAVYSGDAAAEFPVLDIQAPVYVVSQTRIDDGTGGEYVNDYHYAGAKVHLNGRGMLGFREITGTDPQTGIETVTSYRQDFPFIGMPERSESYLNGALISRTENSYAEVADINGAIGVHFPYLSRSVESSYDLPDAGGNPGAPVKTVETDTSYDGYGNPLTINMLTTGEDGTVFGKATTNSYDPPDPVNRVPGLVNRTTVVHTASNVAAPHNLVTKTSAFDYYPPGHPNQFLLKEEIIEPDAGPGSPLYLKTTHEYDAYGNRTKVTTTGLKGYDAASGTESRGTETVYDSRGRFPEQTSNALGHTETYTHDARFGTKTSLTGPNGLTTAWAYDGFGRKVRETRADGTATTWRYDFCGVSDCPNGGFIETVAASGTHPVVTYHDARQRPIRTETTASGGQVIYQDTVYDSRGNVASRTRPYFPGATPQTTTFGYDILKRPLREDAPDGGIVEYYYSGFVRNIHRHHVSGDYDQYDTRINDAMDQLLFLIDADGGVRSYVYDAAGNLDSTAAPGAAATQTGYDLRGRKISMDDPDMGHWEYRYNAFGELVWQRDAKGQVASMTYDRLGRMVSRNEPEGTSSWTYDATMMGVGKLVAVSYAASGHSRSLAYDSLGRLASETGSIDGESFTMAYSYDGFSRRETVTYPTGFMVRNVYDGFGALAEVRDAANDSLYWRQDEADAERQVTLETLGNGLQTARVYNAANGVLESISTGGGMNASVQNLAYIFDALGNLRSRTDSRQGYAENFSYDLLNRLNTAEIAGVGSRSYEYDPSGNITRKSDFGDSYTYGTNGAGPHAVTEVRDGVNTQASYTYDANGNMIGGDGRTITWASFNKALTISKGAVTVSFSYDADHNRVRQVSGDHITYYLSPRIDAGTHYEKELESGQATHTHYIYAGARSIAIYTLSDAGVGRTRYLHTDHLGSTDAITAENGLVVERMSFAAFGVRRHADWNDTSSVLAGIETHHGFTGHEHLDEVGIIHMNGRLYDPKLGRFLSPDPQVQYPDQTQSFNRYTYVNNNPLSFVDPGGYGFFSKLWKKIKTFVVAVVTVAVAVVAFQWGIVYFMSFQSAAIFGLTMASFTYGVLSGGLQKGMGYALRVLGVANAISGIFGVGRTIISGLQSVMQKAVSISDAIEHVARWALHQYTQLKTRQEIERFAKRNGLSLFELNMGLGFLSWSGQAFFGYDRLRLNGSESFGESKDEPGITGIFQNGVGGSVIDAADVALTFQGLPTAQGLSLVAGCGGRISGGCLGSGYQGTLHGHSLGAAEVSVLKGLGLVDKTVGVNVYSLPFTRIAPGGVDVYQGSRDLVNMGIIGRVMNVGSVMVGQAGVRASNIFDYHHCNAGYAMVGCGR